MSVQEQDRASSTASSTVHDSEIVCLRTFRLDNVLRSKRLGAAAPDAGNADIVMHRPPFKVCEGQTLERATLEVPLPALKCAFPFWESSSKSLYVYKGEGIVEKLLIADEFLQTMERLHFVENYGDLVVCKQEGEKDWRNWSVVDTFKDLGVSFSRKCSDVIASERPEGNACSYGCIYESWETVTHSLKVFDTDRSFVLQQQGDDEDHHVLRTETSHTLGHYIDVLESVDNMLRKNSGFITLTGIRRPTGQGSNSNSGNGGSASRPGSTSGPNSKGDRIQLPQANGSVARRIRGIPAEARYRRKNIDPSSGAAIMLADQISKCEAFVVDFASNSRIDATLEEILALLWCAQFVIESLRSIVETREEEGNFDYNAMEDWEYLQEYLGIRNYLVRAVGTKPVPLLDITSRKCCLYLKKSKVTEALLSSVGLRVQEHIPCNSELLVCEVLPGHNPQFFVEPGKVWLHDDGNIVVVDGIVEDAQWGDPTREANYKGGSMMLIGPAEQKWTPIQIPVLQRICPTAKQCLVLCGKGRNRHECKRMTCHPSGKCHDHRR